MTQKETHKNKIQEEKRRKTFWELFLRPEDRLLIEEYKIKRESSEKKGAEELETPSVDNSHGMVSNQNRIIGVILCVLGVAAGIWVIVRFTSLVGKLHTWSPPFDEYEIITFVGLGISVVLLILGIIMLILKAQQSLWQTVASIPEQPETQNAVEPKPEPTEKPKVADDLVSIPEQIEQLAKLKEQGILSEVEFEEKKKELLARM